MKSRRVTRRLFSSTAVLAGIAVFAGGLFLSSGRAGEKDPAPLPEVPAGMEQATFAGGCFWCVEPPFDKLDGVLSTTSGYTGGDVKNPTYEQVSAGGTGHTEAVRVVFDPAKVSYEKLLTVFWHNIDPLDQRGQFCDKGSQYRSGIYPHSDAQRQAAEASRKAVAAELAQRFPDAKVVTEIVPATAFYPAETYHQDYKSKNPVRYQYYRLGCGRDSRLQEVWGDKAGK